MRFDFKDDYTVYRLNEICKRVTRKNKNIESTLPLTISAQYGLVDQITFFNKSVASSNLEGYYLLKNGEFAYNKSYSKDYPWGAIKRLDKYEQGCLSTLYICFDINKTCNSDYLVHYFESPKWYKQVSDIAGEGARNHGLLNISVDDFFQTKHRFPSLDEQVKVSKLLNLIETRIQTQNKIIEGMDSLKQSISIKLFDQLESAVKLCDVCSITKGKQINGSELLEKGQYYMMNGGTEPSGYLNDFNTIEGTISISEGGNSCGYVQYNKEKFWSGGHCYTLKNLSNLIDTKYLYFFLKAKEKDVMALRIGTGLPNIQKKDIESFLIPVPNMEFQNDIVKVLESISLKIDVLKRQLEYYKQQKQYLLSNLFI